MEVNANRISNNRFNGFRKIIMLHYQTGMRTNRVLETIEMVKDRFLIYLFPQLKLWISERTKDTNSDISIKHLYEKREFMKVSVKDIKKI